MNPGFRLSILKKPVSSVVLPFIKTESEFKTLTVAASIGLLVLSVIFPSIERDCACEITHEAVTKNSRKKRFLDL